ncbi:MAG: hypothetical protein KAI47_23900, partial [Deltaproteobacteria bacterium]|nr:hypothetical protein [Deltaproteobacteria bacterium]
SSQSRFKTYRTQVLKDHEVILFKNCFFVLDKWEHHLLKTAADLQGFKDNYLAMRTFFDTRKDRLFVVVTIPPTAYTATTVAEAKLARDFATWLCGPTYLSGHPNVVCWDLFDKLAVPEGQTHANTIRQSYWTNGDAHPNATANKMLATDLANFLISAAESYKAP